MSSHGHGSTLPKFGEWDVNDPATADGFSFVFIKASEEKRGGSAAAAAGNVASQSKYRTETNHHKQYSVKKKWFCCLFS